MCVTKKERLRDLIIKNVNIIEIHRPQAVPSLKGIAGLRQARLTHHRRHSPDTGSNWGEKKFMGVTKNYTFTCKISFQILTFYN